MSQLKNYFHTITVTNRMIFLSLLTLITISNSLLINRSTNKKLAFANSTIYPGSSWQTATPEEMGMDSLKLEEAKNYALNYGGAGHIIRGGKVVMSWGNPIRRYQIKSSTKSIGSIALGMAIADNRLSIDDLAVNHHPTFGVPPSSNSTTGWLDNIRLFDLSTQTAGFGKDGGYVALKYAPATTWTYSDGGVNWLAEVLTLSFNEDLNSLLFRRAFAPIGIPTKELVWRNNADRNDTINGIKSRELASGINASSNALARIGYLFLRKGNWNGQQIIPETFIDLVRSTPNNIKSLSIDNPSSYPNATSHYGILWWNNNDGTLPNVPRDAYWAWGLGDSLIVIIPSLDIVVSRVSSEGFRTGWNGNYTYLEPFIGPIVESVLEESLEISSTFATPSTINDLQTSQLSIEASSPNPITYLWSVPEGQGSLSDTSIQNPIFTPSDVSEMTTVTLNVSVSDGADTLSSTVSLIVTDANNIIPTVNLTAPSNNSTFNTNEPITLSANANDIDGNITKVEFITNGQAVGNTNASPYTFMWSTANAGTYILEARATDNNNDTNTSSSVTVEVVATISPTPTPAPSPILTLTPTPTLTPEAGSSTLTILPIEDTFVDAAYPGTNFGARAKLPSGINSERIIYIKYDLSQLASLSVQSAKLEIFAEDGASSTHFFKSINDTSWSENVITYYNRPIPNPTYFATVANVPSQSLFSVDVTAQVISNTGGFLNFAITPGTERLLIYSKENSAPPSLIVTY